MQFSGEQYELEAGEYAACVTEVGGRLRSLTFAGRPLVKSFGVDEFPPLFRGAVLAPWPNRVADGTYSFAGTRHELAITEPARMTALHGLVVWCPWRVLAVADGVDDAPDHISLACRIWPQQGYPFLLDLELTYSLGLDGLTVELAATNSGEYAAPYGCSIHPYLVAGPGRVDDWWLSVPASQYLEVDADRLLPVGLRSVVGGPMDFTVARAIGTQRLDHAFTGLKFDDRRRCTARVLHPDGSGVEMEWDDGCRWLQVHTADRPEPQYDRVGVVLEPMTCPPNALASGVDVRVLVPGQRTRSTWRIATT